MDEEPRDQEPPTGGLPGATGKFWSRLGLFLAILLWLTFAGIVGFVMLLINTDLFAFPRS